MDGLLIDSEDYYTQCTNEVLRQYGRSDLPWRIKAQLQGRPGPELTDVLKAGRIFQEWAQLPISAEEYLARQSALQQQYFPQCKLMPGVAGLLHTLGQATEPAVQLALATSSNRVNFERKTAHLRQHLEPAFPASRRVLGEDRRIPAGRGKPAPDIYLLALSQINAELAQRHHAAEPIRPAECLVLEDSVPGVEAGRRAGMQAVWCPQPGLLLEYRGREAAVLAGQTGALDRALDGLAGAALTAEQLNRAYSGQMYDDPSLGQPGQLADGWATLLHTLEDFPYHSFAITLKHGGRGSVEGDGRVERDGRVEGDGHAERDGHAEGDGSAAY